MVLDLHFYDCFANNSAKSLAEHIATAAGWRDRILRMQAGGHQVMLMVARYKTSVYEMGLLVRTTHVRYMYGTCAICERCMCGVCTMHLV